MRRFYILLILLFATTYVTSYAQEPILDSRYPAKQNVKQVYIINCSNVPVYKSLRGDETKKVFIKMGDLFFGINESNNRVLIGRYAEKKFTEVIGWVELNDVVKSREPITVGEAVNNNYLKSSPEEGSPFSVDNKLFLRVVAKPGKEITPGSSPGITSKKNYYTFTWYYVYGIEKHHDKFYYLLGNKSDLFTNASIEDTDSKEAQDNLLGWVDRENLQEWCSNIVLEYNTLEPAITERYKQNKPAVIYKKPEEDSNSIKIVESFDIWKPFFNNSNDISLLKRARPYPFGIEPEFPRLYVLEKTGDMYRVATLLSDREEITQERIAVLFSKLREINEKLCTLDLVFVIDNNENMSNEVKSVEDFLLNLCTNFTQMSEKCIEKIVIPVAGYKAEFDLKMDIRVTLISGQNTDETNGPSIIFKTCHLSESSKMQECIDGLQLEGGMDAVRDGVKIALTTEDLWRPYSSRNIVIITDKKGKLGEKDKKDLFNSMPGSDIGLNQAGLDIKPEELKMEYTNIHAIYTNSLGLREFKDNIRTLTYTDGPKNRLYWMKYFKESGREKVESGLGKILYNIIEREQSRIKERLQTLSDTIRSKGTTAKEKPSNISEILDRFIIQTAIKDSGASMEELYKLNDIAFAEGYTPLRQKGHSYDTFSVSVMLSMAEVRVLQDACENMSSGLKKALEISDKTQSPEIQIAKVMLLAVAQVSGTYADYRDNPKLLEKDAKDLLKSIREDDINMYNVKKLLGMKASIPISRQGIIGMPLKNIISLKINELKDYANELRVKSKCLRNILNGETVPESPSEIESHKPMPKVWRYIHPQSRIEFCYIPIQFIP